MGNPKFTRPGAPGASAQLVFESRVATDPASEARSWEIGAAGERAVGRALERCRRAVALHDRVWPGCRANLDHVIIARSGIFVVDTKAYSGRVALVERGAFLRPDQRLLIEGWERSDLVRGAHRQAGAVARALSASRLPPPVPVVGVLCFVGSEWAVPGASASVAGVVLTQPRGLVRLVRRRGTLDRAGVADLAQRLDHLLPPRARRLLDPGGGSLRLRADRGQRLRSARSGGRRISSR